MKKLKNVIIVLAIINIFLFAANIIIRNKLTVIDNNIEEKKTQIENNESQIDNLVSNKEESETKNELVEKEYKVWVHQNEKLKDILH